MKRKILIVDDEQINLDFFDVMLSKLGFVVEKAEDGEEALEKVVSGKPDLIILDNIMPKLSGWEVTKILKTDEDYREYAKIPIIMFSAMDDVKDKIEGFELGIDDYITKPFNFSEVLARIRAVLRSRELSLQVVQKERHIAQIESLNKSLIFFTQHLKQPVTELIHSAKNLDATNGKELNRFVELVIRECEQTLAALKGLEEEIEELRREGEKMQEDALSLKDLEDKFQKHFQNWRSRQQDLNEVRS